MSSDCLGTDSWGNQIDMDSPREWIEAYHAETHDQKAANQEKMGQQNVGMDADVPPPDEPPNDYAQDVNPPAARTGSKRAMANGPDDFPRLWKATDLEPASQPNWLAKGRIPRSAVSLLIGDEGIGKSLLWVWIVAAVTTGKPLPEFCIPTRDPGHVILVCTEDDWSTTVRPRLEVAGADLAMITVICTDRDGSGAPIFPRDIHLILEADPKPALVIVDAWLDTVPSSLSVRDPQQARQALHPWREVSTTTDSAVLLLCHTNRVASANARDRYGATGELRKKARMTLYAQQDDQGHLIVGPEKMNTAAPIPASVFTIKTAQHFAPSPDSDGTVAVLAYIGESDRTAREHISDAYESQRGEGDDQNVDVWLRDFLAEGTAGKQLATEVYKAADAAGYSKDKAKRAKARIGVKSTRPGGDGPWYWELPEPICRMCGSPVVAGQGEVHLSCQEADR